MNIGYLDTEAKREVIRRLADTSGHLVLDLHRKDYPLRVALISLAQQRVIRVSWTETCVNVYWRTAS